MKKILRILFKYRYSILIFFFIYIIFLISSVHENYTDEMDNVLGGYLITQGKLPYTGFFSHHGPLAYYLAAMIAFFSKQSFVDFRILSSVFYILFWILIYVLFKKRNKTIDSNFFIFFIFALALSSTFLWLHMFLADTISSFVLIPAYGLLFLKMYKNEILKKTDLLIISLFSALTLISSPTYIYVVTILTFFTFLHLIFSNNKDKTIIKKIGLSVLIFLFPYIIFFLFLLLTNSLKDYFFYSWIYNRDYYMYNYSSSNFNPIRYAVFIFNNFINSYQVLISSIKSVNFMSPINVTLAFSNLVLWIFLFCNKKYLLLLLSFLMIVYANVRSDPLTLKVADYQSAVYFLLTLFNASIFLYYFKDEVRSFSNKTVSFILLISLSALLTVYWFFSILFLGSDLWRMTYLRYMGQMPLIYDRPQVANIINEVVSKDKYCWVGPLYYEELLYLNCKLPSRFHVIRLPFEDILEIRKELLSDFSKNKPQIIVYKRGFFGENEDGRDKFFTQFIDNNYIKLKDYDKNLNFITQNSKDFFFEENFFFEKKDAAKLIHRFEEKGYIIKK